MYSGSVEGNDPSHRLSLRSTLDLPHGLAFDAYLPAREPAAGPGRPGLRELDLRLGWVVRGGWEISLVGQNLLHASSFRAPAGERAALRLQARVLCSLRMALLKGVSARSWRPRASRPGRPRPGRPRPRARTLARAPTAGPAQETLENDIKATFLYNFTKFIEWPSPPSETSEPFRLCVLADAEFTRAVDRIIAGESVEGRPLERMEPQSPDDARRCGILYVGARPRRARRPARRPPFASCRS